MVKDWELSPLRHEFDSLAQELLHASGAVKNNNNKKNPKNQKKKPHKPSLNNLGIGKFFQTTHKIQSTIKV